MITSVSIVVGTGVFCMQIAFYQTEKTVLIGKSEY